MEKVAGMVAAGKLSGRDKIGVRVGKVIGKYKVGKHFDLDIKDTAFSFSVSEMRVSAEAALDGIYVIRTSATEAEMSAETAVLNYKRLAEVKRAFRTLKGVDLHARASRLISSSACWPITWNGIWPKPGSPSCSQTKLRRTEARTCDPVRQNVPPPRLQKRRPGASPMAHPP